MLILLFDLEVIVVLGELVGGVGVVLYVCASWSDLALEHNDLLRVSFEGSRAKSIDGTDTLLNGMVIKVSLHLITELICKPISKGLLRSFELRRGYEEVLRLIHSLFD